MHDLRYPFSWIVLASVLSCTAALSAKAQTTSAASPLTLAEAIQLALKQSPSARSAAADAALAKAAVTAARASALPSVSASEEAILSDDPVFAFGTRLRQARFTSADFGLDRLNHPSGIGNFASSATASWTAFDFGATRKRIGSTQDAARAAELKRRFSDLEIANSVTALYYRVLLAQSQVSTAQINLVRSREIAADIRDRVHSGLALEADGMRADLAERNAEDDLASAQANVRVARGDLFDAIGGTRQEVSLVSPASDVVTASTGPADVAHRLDLQALDFQRASAQKNMTAIRRSAWPKVSAYGRVESDNPHILGGGSNNWTVGAKVDVSLFDGGARKAREQEAAARLAQIAAQKQQLELTASSQTRELQAQVDDLRRRYDTAERAVQADQEGLRASRDRYSAGLVSVSEVLSGESDLAAAEFARIRSYYQLCIAASNLKLANGSLTIPKAGQLQ